MEFNTAEKSGAEIETFDFVDYARHHDASCVWERSRQSFHGTMYLHQIRILLLIHQIATITTGIH